MNALLVAMRRSLVELNLGLKGDLTMTEPMEKLTKALASDQVRAVYLHAAMLPVPDPSEALRSSGSGTF